MSDELLEAIAYPEPNDTMFMAVTPDNAVTADIDREKSTAPPEALGQLASQSNEAEIFVRILNEGNFIEVSAEVERQLKLNPGAIPDWVRVAQMALAVSDSVAFHAIRSVILGPTMDDTTSEEFNTMLRQAKDVIVQNGPSGVNPDEISWDAVSYKVPAKGAEYFQYRIIKQLGQLTLQEFSVLQELEHMVGTTIADKCQEYRARTQTVPDDFLPDMTLYLEEFVRGQNDATRGDRIARVGKGMLLSYIDHMQAIFVTGNLPSAIQPSKIYSCHDMITAVELRASIQKLSESQVFQLPQLLHNQYTAARATHLGGEGQEEGWTQRQQASINLKRNVDTHIRRVMKIFGEDYDNPMKNLTNKLAGSSNTLKQQLEKHTTEVVVNLTEEQEELAKHQISLLLACLRMRANAVQQSPWEMVTSDDLDHFEIVKFLAQQVSSMGQDSNSIYSIATAMQEQLMNGHNIVKFGNNKLPPELFEMVTYAIEGRMKILAQQITILNEDLRGTGELFGLLKECVLKSLAQNQRISMEFQTRVMRKTARTMGNDNII